MSGPGTFRTSRSCLVMSVHRGEAEIICSFRVFRILTQNGPLTAWITAKAFTLRSSTPGYGPMRPTGVHCNDCWRRCLAGEERRRAMHSTLLSAAPRSPPSWEPAEVQLRPTAIPDRAASRLN
jgi:hypothetical protein